MRECGDCTLCCLTHHIWEMSRAGKKLIKPAGVWCEHCDNINHRCTLYPNHNIVCRTYNCEWREGFGDESFKPTKSGLILDWHRTGSATPRLQIWEAREGALTSAWVKRETDILLRSRVFVAYMYLSGKMILFVPRWVQLSDEASQVYLREGTEIKTYPAIDI